METRKIDMESLQVATNYYPRQLRQMLSIVPETIKETFVLMLKMSKRSDFSTDYVYYRQMHTHLRALIRSKLNKEGVKNFPQGIELLGYAPPDSIEWIRIFTEVQRMVEEKEDAQVVWDNVHNTDCAEEYKLLALKKLAEFFVIDE